MKEKVRVLEIMHGLAPGGIESFVLNMYENIDKSDLDIRFAIACHGKQYHEERLLNNDGIIYRTNDLNGVKNIIIHFFRLIKLLKKEGPFDVVHSHIDFFNGINMLAAFIAGVPVRVSHSHNTNSAHTQDEKPSIWIRVYRKIMRMLVNTFSTNRLGCCLEANLYLYGPKLGNYENSTVIYNGVNIQRFSNKDRIDIEDLNIDDKKLNFITIGRICEQKNSKFIVEIMKELSNIRNDIHLYWVGQGPQKQEIESLIRVYNLEKNITLLGVRKDIPELLNSTDYMIFPSKWEGLPVTLVESQVANVPCFISDKITEEADLGLCTIISLEKNAHQWASEINRHINEKSYNNKIDYNKYNKFNIKEVVKEIEEIYVKNSRSLT